MTEETMMTSIQDDVEANPELQSLIEQSRLKYKSGKALEYIGNTEIFCRS
jgi:hypothetical protein